MTGRRLRRWWGAVRRQRRLGRAALALAVAVAVVVASAERGAGALGPWSGFVGMIALLVLVGGLAQGSVRALGAATGLLGATAVLAGNGRLNGLHGAVEDAAVAAGLLIVIEVGCWSAEVRRTAGAPSSPHGRDVRRLVFIVSAAIGGGALGGLAVAIAAATKGALVGVLPVVGAAVACCLLLLLALALAAPEG